MAKTTISSITGLLILFLMCFSTFFSHGLALNVDRTSYNLDDSSNNPLPDDVFHLEEEEYLTSHWGFPQYPHPHAKRLIPHPKHQVPHPHVPGMIPKSHYPRRPYLHPRPVANGFKRPHMPKQMPHRPFVHPPMPAYVPWWSPPMHHKGVDALAPTPGPAPGPAPSPVYPQEEEYLTSHWGFPQYPHPHAKRLIPHPKHQVPHPHVPGMTPKFHYPRRPFLHPRPVANGFKRPHMPKQMPHRPFVHPPMPAYVPWYWSPPMHHKGVDAPAPTPSPGPASGPAPSPTS